MLLQETYALPSYFGENILLFGSLTYLLRIELNQEAFPKAEKLSVWGQGVRCVGLHFLFKIHFILLYFRGCVITWKLKYVWLIFLRQRNAVCFVGCKMCQIAVIVCYSYLKWYFNTAQI